MSSKPMHQHLRLPLVALCAMTAAACAGSTPSPNVSERTAAGDVADTAAIRDSVATEKAGARSVATPTGVQLSAPPASQTVEAARAAQANPPTPATRTLRDSAAIADSVAKEKAAARSVATPTGVQLSAPSTPPSPTAAQAQQAAGQPGQSMHAGHGAMPSPEGVTFTDPSIAATASASNQGEIQPSQLALQKSQHEGVRAYAQRMIDDHGRFETQMQALLQQKSIAPEPNAFSQQLQQMLPPTLQALQAASGAAFDRLFIEHMVMSHQTTLDALDKALIPSATDPQLKTMLQDTVRPAVAQHLEQAQQLQQQVGRTP